MKNWIALASYAALRLFQYSPVGPGAARAQMLQSITNAKPPASGCNTTPIFLTAVGIGTWTAIAGCGHVTAEAIGAGDFGGHPAGRGGKGGGYGTRNGIVITPGNSYKYQVGNGNATNATENTFWCNSTSNCTAITGSAVQAGGAGGYQSQAYGVANVGATVFAGGAGGVYFNGIFGGGGGGAAGRNGVGAAGSNASALGGGAGGRGDNNTGGTGGAGGGAFSDGSAGNNGVELGSSKGSGGGGGGAAAGYNGGSGGAFGAGGGAGYPTSGVGVGGNGIIILTPAS